MFFAKTRKLSKVKVPFCISLKLTLEVLYVVNDVDILNWCFPYPRVAMADATITDGCRSLYPSFTWDRILYLELHEVFISFYHLIGEWLLYVRISTATNCFPCCPNKRLHRHSIMEEGFISLTVRESTGFHVQVGMVMNSETGTPHTPQTMEHPWNQRELSLHPFHTVTHF